MTQANRPTISGCPANIGYNMAFTVTTPQAGSISRVAVTRCGSITHAFNSDQRYVGLNFTKGSSSLTVTAPPDAKIAPPGYYMLWIIDSQGRVCQLAKFIRICDQKCEINLDVSTFSKHEAQARRLAGPLHRGHLHRVRRLPAGRGGAADHHAEAP